MNYIRHLTGFFDRVALEDRLNPTHISLYMSLFQFWNVNRFVNPISISRSEMMGISKICSKATYHKVMKDLHELGFIKYEPSFNPFRGSSVTLINFDEDEVQKLNRKHTKKQTSDKPTGGRYHAKKQDGNELLTEPYINTKNIVNSKHCKQHTHATTSSDFDKASPQAEAAVFKSQRKKQHPMPLPQSVEEVKTYFASEKSTVIEAEKFFNYFQSNGWKVGGRAPMKDWQAAARNWILNADKFGGKITKTVSFSPKKNYAEPL